MNPRNGLSPQNAKPKQKVLAYITRPRDAGLELLVFRHIDFPEAGVQVPTGTVDADEDLIQAVRREVEEESGLVLGEPSSLVGSFPYFREDIGEAQIRHVFHFSVAAGDCPDQWEHRVSGSGVDQQMRFQFYWLDLPGAEKILAVRQGEYLHALK